MNPLLLWRAIGALVLALCISQTALAQPADASLGLGGQVGGDSGLTLKSYRTNGLPFQNLLHARAADVLLAWNLDGFFFVDAHLLREEPIPDSPLHYFLGPGLFFLAGSDDFATGVSGNFGVNFFSGPFEVYLQVTPRLGLLPATTGNLGGGVGLRYYFR
jgi:hypothetical protein